MHKAGGARGAIDHNGFVTASEFLRQASLPALSTLSSFSSFSSFSSLLSPLSPLLSLLSSLSSRSPLSSLCSPPPGPLAAGAHDSAAWVRPLHPRPRAWGTSAKLVCKTSLQT